MKYIVRVRQNEDTPIYTEYEFSLLQGAYMFVWGCINKGYSASIFEIV